MLFQNFQSYQPVFEILLICIVAGVLGYLFHYVLSRKKWDFRFQSYENKMRFYEEKLRELDELKDKQGLLFKNTKSMTLKINELDALLGLDGKVNSISKTLNSLNFVSSKEFNAYVNGLDEEFSNYKGEVDTRFNELNFDAKFGSFEENVNEKFNNFGLGVDEKIEAFNVSLSENNEKLEEDYNEKINDVVSKLEPIIINNSNSYVSLEEQFSRKDWKDHVNDLSASLTSHQALFIDFKDQFKDYNDYKSMIDKTRVEVSQHSDNLNDLKENYSLLVKQGEEIDGLKHKVSLNFDSIKDLEVLKPEVKSLLKDYESQASSIFEAHESIQEFKKDQRVQDEELSGHSNKIKELFSKFISIDENVEKFEEDFNALHKDFNLHKHPEYDHTSLNKEFKNFSKVFEEHKHDEYDNTSLNKELKDFYAAFKEHQHEEYNYEYLTKDFEDFYNKFDDHKHHEYDYTKKLELFEEKLQFLSEEKLKSKPKAERTKKVRSAAPVVKIQATKRKKLVDNLSIKNIKVSSKNKDDLKLIKGVGPFIEKKINKLGIYTFEQIYSLNKADIELITDAIEFFPGRISRDNWKGQAKKLSKKRKAS